jgi:hypothetical protein
MQGVRGLEHLPSPAQKEYMQTECGGEDIYPNQRRPERVQGVRGREDLPAPAHTERMQEE